MSLKRFFFTILLLIFFTSCGGHKERQDILKCISPDNMYVATFYREYGGGAAGWQQEYVSVLRTNGGKEIVVLEMNHGYDIVLTWVSPRKLEIGYPDSARIDHWQSHFDQKLKGLNLPNWTTELKPIKSEEGSFLKEKTRCGNR